jgi:UDP-glucuronate decarboxylase
MQTLQSSDLLNNKKILITGGLGFIGYALAKRLVDNNQIVVVDNLIRNHGFHDQIIQKHPNLTTHILDVAEDNIGDHITNDDFDYIVHAAAIAGIYTVGKKPTITLRTNTLGTINMLDFALKQKNLLRFVDFSTSEIFGDREEVCTEESLAHIGPIGQDRWGYAASKLIGEYFSNAYFKEFGLKTTTIRPMNIYGGGQLGEGALGNFIIKALKGENLIIHGLGDQVRSWCHIDDFVDGVLLCMTNEKAIGESFNLGNDEQVVTVKNLAEMVLNTIQTSSKIVNEKELKEDIKIRKVSCTKAREILGFSPNVDIKGGIQRTLDSYKNLF